MFAILTGFLISGPFLRARLDNSPSPRLGKYLRARAGRVYPGYWVALAVAALLIGLHNMGEGDVLGVITLTQTFGTDGPLRESRPPGRCPCSSPSTSRFRSGHGAAAGSIPPA